MHYKSLALLTTMQYYLGTKQLLLQNILFLFPRYVSQILLWLQKPFDFLFLFQSVYLLVIHIYTHIFFICVYSQDGSNPDVKNKALSYDRLTYMQVSEGILHGLTIYLSPYVVSILILCPLCVYIYFEVIMVSLCHGICWAWVDDLGKVC